MKNKYLTKYIKSAGNDLATVRFSAICYVVLSNNSTTKVAKIFGWAKILTTFSRNWFYLVVNSRNSPYLVEILALTTI